MTLLSFWIWLFQKDVPLSDLQAVSAWMTQQSEILRFCINYAPAYLSIVVRPQSAIFDFSNRYIAAKLESNSPTREKEFN